MVKKSVISKSSIWKKKFEKNLNSNYGEVINSDLNIISLNNIDINFHLYKSVLNKKELLENQQFDFLNKVVTFDNELGWNDPALPQLWRYNLHYFNYLRELIEIEKINPCYDNFCLLKKYVESWIINNTKIGHGDGWHPYTISLRLLNWIIAYSAFAKYIDIDQQFKNCFLRSIVSQNQYLLSNLEYDVLGNHLFENLKTLIVCGMFLNSSPLGVKSKSIAERELIKQLNEQFHDDGGHFELSAMYHSILLKGITELTYLYKNFGFSVPTEFLTVQNKAYKYLVNIIHPDGEIPLFNDAAFGIAESPVYLLNYAYGSENEDLTLLDLIIKENGQSDRHKLSPSRDFIFYAKDTGYLKTEDQNMFSILDVGKPCPDYLPAHAHADIFSYELSYNEKRIVVDTGTYEYSGLKREYDRSTEAHNTLTINKDNQSQVWGNFRVAERGYPSVHKFVSDNEKVEILASHDGYKKKYGAMHKRKYVHVLNELLLVLDSVNTDSQVESYINLHPDVKFGIHGDEVHISHGDLKIRPINAQFSIEETVYHPKFGYEEITTKVIVTPIEKCPFGYYFDYGNSQISLSKEKLEIHGVQPKLVDLRME